MKLPRRLFPVVALVLTYFFVWTASGQPTGPQPPAVDITALERSLKLLQLESKLRVLQLHYEQAGFFIPSEWPERVQEEHQSLMTELGQASSLKAAGLDSWLEQSKKARENEVLQMVEFMEKHLPTLLKKDKASAEEKQVEVKARELQNKKNLTAQEISKFITQQTLPVVLNGADQTDAGIRRRFSEQWRVAAEEIYRGAIKDGRNLADSIAQYEKDRLAVEARLVFLKAVEEHLEVLGTIRDPMDKLQETVEEKGIGKLQEWLSTNYKDVPDEYVKETWGKVKEEYGGAKELYDKISELDKDMTLKGNPTAMSAAKRFTILSTLYNYTLGKVADSPAMKALGPVKDFLEYYGSALELIPEVAKKTQALVDNIDQQHKGVRALDIWTTVMPNIEPGRLRSLSSYEIFNMQVATDAEIDESSPNARYYFIVEKTVIPRGYASFTKEQFQRLLQAIADERFLNAHGDSSRGAMDWVTENMFEWRSVNLASSRLSDAYLTELKTNAKKTPFTQKQMLDLAFGQPITFEDEQWSAEKFRSKAEAELEQRAREFTARLASPNFTRSKMSQWHAFNLLLIKHTVAFNPKQIVRLFAFYQESEANAAHLEKYILRLGEERAARAKGIPKAGIPMITQPAGGFTIQPGQTVELTAHVNVSDLAPGRTVPAEVTWSLPPWAPAMAPSKVDLVNGVQRLTYLLTAPKDLKPQVIETKVNVKVPGEPVENALAAVTKPTRQSLPPAPNARPETSVSLPSTELPFVTATPPAPARGFKHVGKFEVEAAGPISITVKRGKNYPVRTAIEATSDLFYNSPSNITWMVTLYAASSATGPFVEVDMQYAYAGNRIQKEEGNGIRTGTNTIMFLDRRDKNEKEPRQPWYYQIGLKQKPGTFATPSVGNKELKSNIAGPGRAELKIFARQEIIGSAAPADAFNSDSLRSPFNYSSDEWINFNVSLSTENQVFDYPGVHFTVKSGDWTGHYWTSQLNGTNEFANSRYWNYRENRVRVSIPFKGGTFPVTITAQSPGLSLTRTITLNIDPKINSYAVDASRVAEEESKRMAYIEKEEQKTLEAIPRLEKEYASAKEYLEKIKSPGVAMNTAHSLLHSASNKLAFARFSVLQIARYEKPQRRFTGDRQLADARDDWKAALAAERELMALTQTHFEMELLQSAIQWDGNNAESQARMAEFYQKERVNFTNTYSSRMLDHRYRLARFALLAGEPAIFRQAMQEVVERQLPQQKEPGDFSSYAQRLKEFGAMLAVLTGDQAEAARIFLWGRKIALEKIPKSEQEALKDPLPTWWPAEPVKESPLPRPKVETVIARNPGLGTSSGNPPTRTTQVTPPTVVTPPVTNTRTNVATNTVVTPPPIVITTNAAAQKAYALTQQQKWPEAEAAYREALRENANDPMLNHGFGNALAGQLKWKEAEAAYRKSLSLSPTNAAVHYALSATLGYQNRWAEMIPPLAEAARLDPNNAEYHYRLGAALYGQQRFAEAVVACKRSLQITPANASCQAFTSSSLMALGKPAEAEPFAREAARLEPNNGAAQLGLGYALTAQNKWVESEPTYRLAVRLLPADPAAAEGLGHVFMAQGKWAEAEAIYRQAIRLNTTEGRYYGHVAAALARQQRVNDAVPMARQAMALGERSHWILKELGLIQ
ncbi:MAG: sulfotransferase family protein [Verrucomicrobia bacterium]|nr:sulfotransferase family protein [Verrucomicrobiota bacterium]